MLFVFLGQSPKAFLILLDELLKGCARSENFHRKILLLSLDQFFLDINVF